MPTTTPNIGLHVTPDTDIVKNVLTWRGEIAGDEPTSNMMIIDAEINNLKDNKAAKSIAVSGTLYANAWIGADSPFTQEILISGLTQNHNGFMSLSHDATAAQRDVARESMLTITGQTDGKLIVSADGELPSLDIPVTVILLG